MSSFTSAPWRVAQNTRLEIVAADEMQTPLAHVYKSGRNAGVAYSIPGQANAYLIVAAPDMYEALEEARKTLTSLPPDGRVANMSLLEGREFWYEQAKKVHAQIVAALKKARGE